MKEVIEINKQKSRKELKMEFDDGQENWNQKEENGEEQCKEFQAEKHEIGNEINQKTESPLIKSMSVFP